MSTPPGTRAPSPAPVERATGGRRQAATPSDDEYDRFFDDEVLRLHDELSAASDVNDAQSGAAYVSCLSLLAYILILFL